jgi:PmbA protein
VDTSDFLNDLVSKANARGADAADAVLVSSRGLELAQRQKEPEKVERAESQHLGLRVLIGKRQAIASSNDWAETSLNELVDRALSMARAVPEDPYCGLADTDELAKGEPLDLELCDSKEPTAEELIELARTCEEAALDVDGVTNSEGADASWSRSDVTLAASNGFSGRYAISRHGIGVAVLAGEGTAMERDYEFTSAVFAADMKGAAEIGRIAGERTVQRLNPRKVPTSKVPVVYDPRVSAGLVGHLASAINGAAIARGTSFLKDEMSKMIFSSDITIVDDPHRKRGLRSKPFDAEGLSNTAMKFVDAGKLMSWVLDLRSARQLGLSSTGRASRGTSSPPSPTTTNLYLEAGKVSPQELMADIKDGFYVTELMGFGINNITGDYSRGAAGFWIENGKITYPISEMTIAGNLTEMFLNMMPANDLVFRFGTDAPTVRVEGMTVAGA